MLWRSGERKKTQVCLPAAFGHAAEQFLHVGHALAGGLLCRLLPQVFASKDFLEVGRSFSALGTVGLVDDDRAPAGRQHAGCLLPAFFRHPQQLL